MLADISVAEMEMVLVVCTNSGRCMVDGCANGEIPRWMLDGSCFGVQNTFRMAADASS